MKRMRMIGLCVLCAVMILQGAAHPIYGEEAVQPIDAGGEAVSDLGVKEGSLAFDCKSVILMEANTGTVLYTQNADEALPPASVTKVMTLLLVMEAVDSGVIHLEDQISISANAASMGGSQVYLKEGERMSVEDLLKSVVIASANDAAVALAEYVCGSVPTFVEKMNERAGQLGMKNTKFENVTGLDDTAQNHLTSARDIALMSRELIKHKTVLQYSSIWMDSIRNGEFGLTNTNRLVRFYPGCTGLKTGSTSKAGFCVSVTAERDGMSLICVVMGAESRDVRNAIATQALDWGFASFGVFSREKTELEPMPITGGVKDTCPIYYEAFSCVLPKGDLAKVEVKTMIPEVRYAPVKEGESVAEVLFTVGDRVIGKTDVFARETVLRINYFEILKRMLAKWLLI